MNSLCICKSRLLFTYPTVKNPNKVITSDLSLVADFYSLLEEFSNIKPMFASCLQCKQSRFLALYLTWTLFSSLHTFSPSLLKVIFCSDSFHKVVIFVVVVFFCILMRQFMCEGESVIRCPLRGNYYLTAVPCL